MHIRLSRLLPSFLFTLANLLFLYADTSVIASPDQVIRPLLVFGVVLVILAIPAYKLVQDWNWAGALLVILAATMTSSPQIFKIDLGVMAGVGACYIAVYLVKRKNSDSDRLIGVLNIFGLIFVFSGLLNLWGQAYYLPLLDIPQFTWHKRSLPMPLVSPERKPDIYYIVLDGYGREDILNEYYGFDNSDFIEALEGRGFVVPSAARANYPKTALSIASTLNMDYVSNLVPGLEGKDISYWWLMKPLIRDSNVRRLLEDAGYKSYSTTTGWGITDDPTTDVYYQPQSIIVNDFESFVLSGTPSGFMTPLLDRFSYVPSFEDHRSLILHNFKILESSFNIASPKFVFSHIISPHPPFIFGDDGQPTSVGYEFSYFDANDVSLTDEEYRVGYSAQLKFINKKVLNLVDAILINSDMPPIIILQGDHGPGMFTDFYSLEGTCLKERFSIFAAYYLPDVQSPVFVNDVTPVNTFRIIFNEYFESEFSLLNDHHYFSFEQKIFISEDVSHKVDTCSFP